MAQPGYVYALINPSMPGLVKVGRTERDPSVRVSELSGVTGVATPFILIFHQAFEDCALAERHAHAALERHGRRFSANREFFETEPTTAIHAILKAPGATETVPDVRRSIQEVKLTQTSLADELVSRARAYHWGNGDFPPDVKEAVKIYLKAGKLGSGQAYYELSGMYGYGGPFMSDGWLAKNSKSNESKQQEYMRRSCELNYAPAWASIAFDRIKNSNPNSEARAWRKFFSIVIKETPQGTVEGENNGYWSNIYDAKKFLTPRQQLELDYFPCAVRIGDEIFDEAVEFIRWHADAISVLVERSIEDIRIDQRPIDPASSYDMMEDVEIRRNRMITAWQEILRWLNEL